MNILIALIAGLLFGAGLAISGMTDTQVILGFLDIFGDWNPAAAIVMGSALLISIPAFHLVLKRSKPVFDDSFHMPSNTVIDAKLMSGAIIFGIGWGLYGWCPGPAIASLSYANIDTVVFLATMVIGMLIAERVTA